MNTNKITDWTIGECCTKATGVVLSHFRGSAAEVQILLLKMVKQLKNIDPGEYVHGTETLKELTSEHEEYTATAVFWAYEVKITAKETCHVKEITDKYVAGDFKATNDKMQALKKGLKSSPEETISQMPEEELKKFYDKYAFSVERNISHILTVSTGHISKKTRDFLTRVAHSKTYFPIAVYEKGNCGFYLYVPDEIDDTVPVELKHLLQITKSLGCAILCLDNDGNILPNVEYFNW